MQKGNSKKSKPSTLRRRAEKRLAGTQTPKDQLFKNEDPLKLIHELQVHQIELEMQNEELIQARAEAEANLEKYSDLYDFAPVGYFTLSDDGIIREANLTGATLLGKERSRLINLNFSMFLSSESRLAFVDFLREVFAETTKKTCEVMLANNNDSPTYVHIEGTAVNAGKSIGWQCRMVIMDITRHKLAEKEKKKLEIQLAISQKMEALGTFAGGITHDFNNILAAIIGYAELGIMEVSGSDKVDFDKVLKEFAGVIHAGERAKELIKQIISFSRHAEKNYMPVRLSLIIREALKMLRAIIPANIEIRENLLSSGIIMADSTQTYQMIMNLCSNAVNAMGEAGGVLGVTLEEIHEEDLAAASVDLPARSYLRLTISDTGRGMTSEVMDRIYEPYFTTEDRGKGTGLGLAVVHGIVNKHEGHIHCTSTPGKGTEFAIYLPKIESAVEVMKQPPVEPSLPTGTERVLFIDDEPDLVETTGRRLERLGYKVTSATSSTKALEIFSKHPDQFDLIITDMTMPDMTGDRLAKSIMAIRPDIPVILCTGYSEYITEEEAKKIGIREFVMKPFLMLELARSIRKIFD